jgi:glycosyltransferase involved in cell wall biosynthesis
MPKVSVVCIVYNSMAYLPDTIASVLNQTFTDFELIIVNDGSTDHVIAWVSELDDPRIQLITKPNQGIAQARNTGIHVSRGDYLAFLDGDDLWHPAKLERQVAQFEQHQGVGLVHTHVELIDEQGRHLGKSLNMNIRGDARAAILVSNFIGTASAPMVKRQCFEALGEFYAHPEIAWCDDWDMWARIASRYAYGLVPQPLTRYRLHSQSASAKYQMLVPLVPKIVERLYQNAPPEFLHLKTKTYGTFYLYLASRALDARNYVDAGRLLTYAMRYRVSPRWLQSGFQIGISMLGTRLERLLQSVWDKLR